MSPTISTPRVRHEAPSDGRSSHGLSGATQAGSQGKSLGKTTGWVHRATVKMKGVEQISGARYDRIDDEGLHISFPDSDKEPRVLRSTPSWSAPDRNRSATSSTRLTVAGVATHVIGGADVAAELDAKRAIRQGTEVAAAL